MALKPLSQSGLHNAVTSPNTRPILRNTGKPAKRTVLRANNQARRDRGEKWVLHATKGWRLA